MEINPKFVECEKFRINYCNWYCTEKCPRSLENVDRCITKHHNIYK